MENLSIIGCGTKEHSIALLASWAAIEVKVSGVNEQDIATADKGLRNKLTVMVQNELFNETTPEEIRKRIVFSTSLEEVVREAAFIIEVIPENSQMKRELYKEIEAICSKDTLLASNTSGIHQPKSVFRHIFGNQEI